MRATKGPTRRFWQKDLRSVIPAEYGVRIFSYPGYVKLFEPETMHTTHIDTSDDWTNPRTSALYRPTIQPVAHPGQVHLDVPTDGDWRLRVDLRDQHNRTRRLLLQRHQGRCTVASAQKPSCIDCNEAFDRIAIHPHRILLMAGARIVAAIQPDQAGKPVLAAQVEDEGELTPATALFYRLPLTKAIHSRRTIAMDLSRPTASGRHILSDPPPSELETLPMSSLELQGCH